MVKRGRQPKVKKYEVDVNGNGLLEDVYNFNVELEDTVRCEPDNVSGNKRRSCRNSTSKRLDVQQEESNKCQCGREFDSVKGLKRHQHACVKATLENVPQADTADMCLDNKNDNNLSSATNVVLAANNTGTEICDADSKIILTIKQEVSCLIEDGKCDCCGEDVQTAHLEGQYSCSDCNIHFKHLTGLNNHRVIIHNEGDGRVCKRCFVKCPNKKVLSRHMRIRHTDSGSGAIICPICNKTFTRRYHLIRHNLQTGCNGVPKQTFPCQVCSREFTRKDNLREHLRAHAGQTRRKKIYNCEHCDVQCIGASTLIEHRKMHVGDKQYGCNQCNKSFSTSGALKKHTRKHTGERPYLCQECGATFSAKETLNRHVKRHTGVKPHVCIFCGKRFIQASQLRAHIFHHTGENGFRCETCDATFNRKTRLDLHIKFSHLGAKPLNCKVCGKTFLRKEDLARHEILHTGVKDYKCEHCDKTFAIKASLKIHLLTHNKEPPTSCDECGRAFIRQDCLLRHMRKKHREKLEEIMAVTEKKKLQAHLLSMASAIIPKKNSDGSDDVRPGQSTTGDYLPAFMSDDALADAINQLLVLLVDEKTMKAFGWPRCKVDKILERVIRRCGHSPISSDELSYIECLRENTKVLLTVIIDDEAVKTLLNKQTVDEVILHILQLAST